MPFVIQQHLSRGASTPCVARTVLQTQDLIGAFELTQAEKDELMEISHAVMLKLTACLDAAEPVLKAIEEGKARVAAGEVPVQGGGRVVELPSVLDLRSRAETFLGQGKLAVREIMRLFKVFDGKEFDHRFQKVLAWAKEEFGENDPFYVALVADAGWIAELVGMRNSIEHPGSVDGTFAIEGFRLVPRPTGGFSIEPPVWHRFGHDVREVAREMQIFQDNLLTLFEDILAEGLKRRGAGKSPIEIVALPESERDPKVPIRLRLAMRGLPPAP